MRRKTVFQKKKKKIKSRSANESVLISFSLLETFSQKEKKRNEKSP